MILRTGRVVLTLLVVGFAAWALASQWDEFLSGIRQLGPGAVLLSAAAAAAALVASALAWRALMSGIGAPQTVRAAVVLLLASQLAKFIPGGVGPVITQAALAERFSIQPRRIVQGYLLLTVVTLITGLLLAVLALAAAGAGSARGLWWAALLALALLPVLHPGFLARSASFLGGLIGRDLALPKVRTSAVAVASVWMCGAWFAYGAHVLALAMVFESPDAELALLSLGGFALAWCTGFLILFLPSGLGARELALAAVLTPVIGAGPAAGIAVTSRVVLTVIDAVGGGLAWLALGARRFPAQLGSSRRR